MKTNKQIERLNRRVAEGVVRFEREVSKLLKIPFTAHYTGRDRIRLLNLLVWSQRTKLSYSTILHVLMEYWSRRGFQSRNSRSLGVRPASLTGAKSWDLITRYLEERCPHNEQVVAWKHTERQRLAAVLLGEERVEATVLNDPSKFEAAYRRQIREQQKEAAVLQRKMRRRNYRDNPFL